MERAWKEAFMIFIDRLHAVVDHNVILECLEEAAAEVQDETVKEFLWSQWSKLDRYNLIKLKMELGIKEDFEEELKIVDFVECIEPFEPGVNHYDTWIVRCNDGKYYVAVRHGTPYPNGPYPTEGVSWEIWEVKGPGFANPEEARKWWFEPEGVGANA